VLRQSYNVDFRYVSLFEVIGTVAAYAATVILNDLKCITIL